MAYTDIYYGGRGQCPKCGRFCRNIVGCSPDDLPVSVEGECVKHGVQDLTAQGWSWDEFRGEYGTKAKE